MKIFIIILTVIAILSSCQERTTIHSVKGWDYELDTINIHGINHEFLIKHKEYLNGFTHSPECPCLKK